MSTLPPYVLQEYHQDIISAVWMVILSLYAEDPLWAGAILLSFLICMDVMRRRIEYHQAMILVGWMILLCLIPDRGPGLHEFRTMSTFQPNTLQEVHHDIISAAWMIMLSLYREDPVWAGAILV